MLPNLYTIFHGNYGNKPLKKEMTKIIKIINDKNINNDGIKNSLINYVVRRAAMQNIEIDYKYFEGVFLDVTKTKKEKYEYSSYGDTCFAFAYYFYRNKIHPKKALFYLKESIKYPYDECYLYSRFILLAYFYNYGFGVKKDFKQVIRYISATNKIVFHGRASIECGLNIKYEPVKFDVPKDVHYCC